MEFVDKIRFDIWKQQEAVRSRQFGNSTKAEDQSRIRQMADRDGSTRRQSGIGLRLRDQMNINCLAGSGYLFKFTPEDSLL